MTVYTTIEDSESPTFSAQFDRSMIAKAKYAIPKLRLNWQIRTEEEIDVLYGCWIDETFNLSDASEVSWQAEGF